ncbi:hypothetical protein ABT160_38555 [Streptomyces sp. NPDC001941]|uniref:hypothetical protein n=1 Tax=Streptomyces sp. NPDC001941 TaxID=3154659 RepID=UPI00332A4B45
MRQEHVHAALQGVRYPASYTRRRFTPGGEVPAAENRSLTAAVMGATAATGTTDLPHLPETAD